MSQTTAPPPWYWPFPYPTAAVWWMPSGACQSSASCLIRPGTATEQDVIRLDDHEDRLCELIDGTLVEKTMGYEESAIAMQIGALLGALSGRGSLGLSRAKRP